MADYYIYSDESGAWQNNKDIYVRAWICVDEINNQKIINFIENIKDHTDCDEVRWKTVAPLNLNKEIKNIDFKVFVSVTEINSIKDEKYLLTRSFDEKINNFNFGNLKSATTEKIKNKIYLDIKYVLFLHIYESLHLKSAQEIFSEKFKEKTFNYIIDPPQMLTRDWSKICEELTGYKPSFPSSEKTQGIQFADIIAGAWRSFIIQDEKIKDAHRFICEGLMPDKMLYIKGCPNPNLIIHEESSAEIKKRCTVSSCKI